MEDSTKQTEARAADETASKTVANPAPEKITRTREGVAPPTNCECPPGCVGLPCCN